MSFKDGSEWIVALLVLGALLATELGVRAGQDFLSLDIAHLNRAETIVRDLTEAEGLRILVTGNSLTREGVDGQLLEAGLREELGRDVTVAMVYPDASGPADWSFFHRKIMFYPDQHPDLVVLGFGIGQLPDRPHSITLSKLAAHYVDRRDVGTFILNDLDNIEERSQFVLGRMFKTFALRERIAPRVLDALIPWYREMSPILLQVSPVGTEGEAPAAAEAAEESAAEQAADLQPGPSFHYLGQLVDDYVEAEVPLIGMPVPAPSPWQIHPRALALFEGADVPLLPTFTTLTMEDARFPDGAHMDPAGKALFTEALVPDLAAAIRAHLQE
jgi:hypothetical protein